MGLAGIPRGWVSRAAWQAGSRQAGHICQPHTHTEWTAKKHMAMQGQTRIRRHACAGRRHPGEKKCRQIGPSTLLESNSWPTRKKKNGQKSSCGRLTDSSMQHDTGSSRMFVNLSVRPAECLAVPARVRFEEKKQDKREMEASCLKVHFACLNDVH